MTLLFVGCSGAREAVPDKQENPELKVFLSSSRVTPDAQGLVEVDVELKGLSKASSLTVVRKGKTPFSKRVGAGVLTERFTFQSPLAADEIPEVAFDFFLTGKDKRVSSTTTLVVDNSAPRVSKALNFKNFTVMSRVTGKEDNAHDGLPKVMYTLYNNTHSRFDVGGTDLGITWEITPGKYGMFFGDTFGGDFVPNLYAPNPGGSNWRGNVLLFSEDTDLSDGLTVTDAATDYQGRAREICFSAHITDGNSDYTSIPTGAVHAGSADYVHYMNIRTWYGWVSNFSSYYKSTDAGKNWHRVQDVSFASRSNFGQVGMFNHEGYVYIIGTVTGRSSYPRLARVKEDRMDFQDEYEFWNGTGWIVDNEGAAAPVFDDYSGELSFAWFPQWRKWIILYLNEQRNDQIIMRYADNIIGPWSDPLVLTDGTSFWRPYGSFIHPLSLQGGDRLYFIMSAWNAYNTYLISCRLFEE